MKAGIVSVALAVGALAAGLSAPARAGCGVELPPKATPQAWLSPQPATGNPHFIRTGFDNFLDDTVIVGLWKFELIGAGNTGDAAFFNDKTIDKGYVTWHIDGTEIMNSGRSPTTGSFCMGVWEQVRARVPTFKLNHFALNWNFNYLSPSGPPGAGVGGAQYNGPTSILETVSVDRSGNAYTGSFTLTNYAPTAPAAAVLQIKGNVKATRITVNTSIDDAGVFGL